jgi:hypothetical protein
LLLCQALLQANYKSRSAAAALVEDGSSRCLSVFSALRLIHVLTLVMSI